MRQNTSKAPAAAPALSLLAFMMAVGPFGDTEYTPAMPDIAHALNADYGLVQITMVSYLIADGFSELAYGPLADRSDRRPVMLGGAGVLTLGALICVVSFSVWSLVGGRLFQGLGASAGGVIAKAAVRDTFAPDQREKVFAQLQAAFALAPAVGPVVGSLVSHSLRWHINFVIKQRLRHADRVPGFDRRGHRHIRGHPRHTRHFDGKALVVARWRCPEDRAGATPGVRMDTPLSPFIRG